MLPAQPLEIVPYNPEWPNQFEQERARLAAGLRGVALRIDHHGSTAIPGLAAKPAIDIQISVAAVQPMDAYRPQLIAMGYIHVPHADDGYCPYFHRPASWQHTHHIHVVEAGGEEERRTLAFRDYLRKHGEVRQRYEALKRVLAPRFDSAQEDSRQAYADAKGPFIESVIERALGQEE